MKNETYTQYSEAQLNKIGNTAIYLSERIQHLSKTKFLKLLYILDELSIKQSGIPFFNLDYKVWKFGPVAEPIFIDLSSEMTLLSPFIKSDKNGYLSAKKSFNDDEFSDNDINLLDEVIERFGNQSAKQLVTYTHNEDSLWNKTAKEHNVLALLENEMINSTNLYLNLADLVANDPHKKAIYEDYIEQF
ncbi:Panacea domain-containing protein [Capnocytophaga sputigena]|jgi:hypothetical protein BACCOPRO_01416